MKSSWKNAEITSNRICLKLEVYVCQEKFENRRKTKPSNKRNRQWRGRENGVRKRTLRGGAEGAGAAGGALGGGDPSGVALHGLLLGEPLDEGGQVPHPGAGLRDLPEHPGRRGVAELRQLAARPRVRGLAQLRLEARELRRHRRGRRERRGTRRGLHSEPRRAGRV